MVVDGIIGVWILIDLKNLDDKAVFAHPVSTNAFVLQTICWLLFMMNTSR
jgi:hypothetical protein